MSVRKFKNGDLVVVNDKMPKISQENGFTPGMVGKIINYYYDSMYGVAFDDSKTICQKSNYFDKAKPKSSIERFNEQIEQALEKIEKTQAFINETKSKIAFMQEVGSDNFDENEFKAYHTLTIIEQSDMSKIEKAKAIAALISGK
jgi:hypothetical protein